MNNYQDKSLTLSQGAFFTFSNIAVAGCFWSRYSTAARNVSPDVPLSSISINQIVETNIFVEQR